MKDNKSKPFLAISVLLTFLETSCAHYNECTNCRLKYGNDLNDCGQYVERIQNLADRDEIMAICLRGKGYSSVGEPCEYFCK